MSLLNNLKQSYSWIAEKGNFMTVMQVGLFAVIPYAVMEGNAWWWLLAFFMYFLYGMVGTAVTMHRLLTHRTFTTGKLFRYFGTFMGAMGSLLSPLEWAQQHVAHHRFSDTEKDPHSPVQLGWKAIFFCTHGKTTSTITTWRLFKEPFMYYLHKYYYLILFSWITLFYLIGGFKLVVFAWALPCLATLWGQVLGVMAHDEHGAVDSNIFSRIFTFNESKHRYHHINPGDITQDGILYHFINLVRTDRHRIK